MDKTLMKADQALKASDELLEAEIAKLLSPVGTPSASIAAATAELYLAELHRRSTQRLWHSSERIERLTKWLIALTFVLALLTLPPALEIVMRFMRR